MKIYTPQLLRLICSRWMLQYPHPRNSHKMSCPAAVSRGKVAAMRQISFLNALLRTYPYGSVQIITLRLLNGIRSFIEGTTLAGIDAEGISNVGIREEGMNE